MSLTKTKTHPPNRHHCNNLDDLRPLVEQLGYTVDETGCLDTERVARCVSVEPLSELAGSRACVVRLDKVNGILLITTPNNHANC